MSRRRGQEEGPEQHWWPLQMTAGEKEMNSKPVWDQGSRDAGVLHPERQGRHEPITSRPPASAVLMAGRRAFGLEMKSSGLSKFSLGCLRDSRRHGKWGRGAGGPGSADKSFIVQGCAPLCSWDQRERPSLKRLPCLLM